MKKLLTALASAAVIGFSATQANAVLVDFTSDYGGPIDWLGAGVTSTTNDVSTVIPSLSGVSITISSNGGILNSDTVSATPPCSSSPLACDFDGVGIGDDEVTNGTIGSGEVLTVKFSKHVDILGIGFLDLFKPDAESGPAEVAEWLAVTNSAPPGGSVAGTEVYVDTSSSGFITTAVLLENLDTISFFNVSGPANSDFALALLDVRLTLENIPPVPIPAALPLFAGGLGLFGLLGWRRRRGASAA